MITNAREYQITKAQCARLVEALNSPAQASAVAPSPLSELERQALKSEVDLLSDHIRDYENLYEGRLAHLEVEGLGSLPSVLIKARIASRMTQKELAERLGVHMQQVQRYEASGYRAVSFERMLEIAQLLGVKIKQDVVLAEPLVRRATTALEGWGLTRDFLVSRGIVSGSAAGEGVIDSVASFNRLQHIFGWSTKELESQPPLRVSAESMGRPLFKLPGGRRQDFVQAYSAYAFRVASGAAKCAADLPTAAVPTDAEDARRQILELGPITLQTVIDWAWSLGIAVLPLRDRAGFHGAFWRIEGRNVIVLKQQTSSLDRLMHDTLHEVFHASQEPELASRSVIDTSDLTTSSKDPEEQEANMFASNVLLAGRANELAEEVAREAGNHGPALKRATSIVARRHGVSAGALANHLAWVLQQQAQPFDWWGTAQNLQTLQDGVLEYARDIAFVRLVPPRGSDIDAELLFTALRSEDQ
ncbi:MAG: ImmA/IrrE family metallo-endopeptidase [Burkholderiales bacterium]|nr:ImmA/IrrE family metallo-endopeptidase [Burkholderiales bacterium]